MQLILACVPTCVRVAALSVVVVVVAVVVVF